MTAGPGIEPGTHWWKTSALTNPAPCFPGWWEGRYTSVRFKFFMELLIFATYFQSSSQRLQLGLPALKQTAHTQSTKSNIGRRSD